MEPESAPGFVFISDPHANLVALEAVLADAAPLLAQGFRLVTLGDLVGMGPHPAATLTRLRGMPGVLHVRGNNDRYVADREFEKEIFHRDVYETPPAGLRDNLRWTNGQLSAADLDFLRGQPERLELSLGPFRVLALHGGPASDEEPVVPERVDEAFAARIPEHDILAVGHTHRPFVKAVGGKLIVNAGGCGSSLDRDPRAAYATLALAGGRPAAEVRRVPYDLDATAAELERVGAPWRETIVAVMRAAGMPRLSP